MRKLLSLIFLLFSISIANAQVNIHDLTEDTSPARTDEAYTIKYNGTRWVPRKALWGSILNLTGWSLSGTTISTTNNVSVTGTVTATAFVGDGSGLTGISGVGSGSSGWTDGGSNIYTTTSTDTIGIGTAHPTSLNGNWLVALYSSSNGNRAMAVQNPNTGTSAQARFEVKTSDSNGFLGNIPKNSTLTPSWAGRTMVVAESGNGVALVASSGAGDIDFLTSGTTRAMRIAGSSMAMGTTTPTGRMDIRGDEVRIWTGSGTNTNSTGSGELYVEGDLEVDGTAYFSSASLGTSTATTPSGGDNDTSVATTAYVQTEIASISAGLGGWTDGGTSIIETTTTDAVGIGTTTVQGSAKLNVGGGHVRIGVGGTNTSAVSAGELYVQGDLEVDGTVVGTVVTVTDDAYAAGWDSSTAVPTKNAVYDKIETLGASSGGWTDGGANMVQSTTTDNVGIGTTTPTAKLDVWGTVKATQFETEASDQPQTNFNPILAGDTHWTLGMDSDGGGSSNDPLYLVEGTDVTSASARRLYISPGGNIGVGSIAPTSKLTVNGTVTATAFAGDGSALTGITGGSIGIGTANTITFWPTTNTIGSLPTATYPSLTELSYVKGATSSLQTQINSLSVGAGGWVDGGTNVYVSPTTDNVAIGTTTPSTKLTVAGTVTATAFVGDGSGITGIGAGGWTDAGAIVYTSTTTDNVGIGTANPEQKLTLKGSSTANVTTLVQNTNSSGYSAVAVNNSDGLGLSVISTGSGYALPNAYALLVSNGQPLHFGEVNGTLNMTVYGDGNVGIGSVSPSQKLDVNGTAKATTFSGSAASLTGIFSQILDYGTSASSSTERQASALKVAFGGVSIAGSSNQALSNLPFSSSSSYIILCSFGTATDAIEACVAKPSSGSAATLYNNDNLTETVYWFAVGT